MMNKKRFFIEILIGIFISIAIFIYFSVIGFYPTGNDIYGHLYKTEILTENIRNGNFYPLYTSEWYNGIQLYRYWPIFTYYILSFFHLFFDIHTTYYIFLSFTFLLSFYGFCKIANRENNNILIIIGILYWFLPDNIRVIFGEGNLARVMIMAMLPIFFYYYTNVLEYKKSIFLCILCVSILTITHFMLAAMTAIIFTIYGFFKCKGKYRFYGCILFILGFITSGLILYPGLKGGLVSDSNSASINTMKDWSQSLLTSVSITNRMETVCSFGLVMLIITILSIIFSKKKCGAIIGLIFFTLTSEMFIPLLIQLPLSQVWWMARFVQMAYILILYDFAFIELPEKYKELKNKFILILFILLILDILPSYQYFNRIQEPKSNEYLMNEAIDLTSNRLGLIDESLIGSYPSYFIWEKDVDYMQGWAIQGASTNSNIITLTESLKNGFYGFAFKNSLELGCDSLLVSKLLLNNLNYDEFIKQANYYGYVLIKENENMFLFDLKEVNGNFGVNFNYKNLAIGNSSIYISYYFPSFEQGESIYIEDYTFEKLLQYDKIYLSNFKYKDKEKLELVLSGLSKNGIDVYIDTTHLPINYLTVSELFNVESRFISLYGVNYIDFNGKPYKLSLPYEWYSTYLVGDNLQTFSYAQQNLGFYSKLENIHFIGLNLPYLYFENKEPDLMLMFNEMFNISEEDNYVDYEISPIEIIKSNNGFSIVSEKKINTTIAYQDNFVTNRNIEEKNNLLVVNSGMTNIKFKYPSFGVGLFLSLMGMVLDIIFIVYNKKERGNTK